MHYQLFYHPDVKVRDLPEIPRNIRERIREAIERRLATEPSKYGEPLRRSLHGWRKMRVGDYRVIYRVDQDKVAICKIGHRKEVYTKAHLRMDKE